MVNIVRGVAVLRSVLKSLFSRAVAGPDVTDLRGAQEAYARGELTTALERVDILVARMPEHAPTRYCAGVWLAQAGRMAAALPHLEHAVALAPTDADAWLALGNVRRALGDASGAEQGYQRAVALAPDSAGAHYNLGLVVKAASATAAVPHFERACVLAPDFEDAQVECVLALVGCGRLADAQAHARRARTLLPASGRLAAAAGYALQKDLRPEAALASYDEAERLGAADHELWNNRGIVLQDLGRMDDALVAYERALAVKPGFVLARFHRGLARLARREYGTAWDDYALRLQSDDGPRHPVGGRAWAGEPLAGRSILVIGEQGLGDEIMFASCVPDLLARGGRVTLACTPRLASLFRRSFPAADVVALQAGQPLAVQADFHVFAGSLPGRFRRSAADFPRHAGYLQAAPERVAYWRERLATLGPGMKLGMSWRGGTAQTRARLRHVPFGEWEPLFALPGVRYVSLQYGDADEVRRAGYDVTVWPEALDDYDETAALVAALDGVVSVCTAVIHLAGALGRRVWVMAPASPEWRYGIAGDRMDWYPAVRVFRQRVAGAWTPVIADVTDSLRNALETRPAR